MVWNYCVVVSVVYLHRIVCHAYVCARGSECKVRCIIPLCISAAVSHGLSQQSCKEEY